MNKDVKALIDRIDIDEHLEHYRSMTHAQRARMLGDMFAWSYSIKRDPRVAVLIKKLSDKKLTPAMCRGLSKKVSSVAR